MIICFGELLFRMSPSLGMEWIRSSSMPVHIGGAELNVATALANWQTPVKYFTSLPDNYLSHEIIQHIEERGIDASSIDLSGSRIGIYYLPQGRDLKNAAVIYDRANSSFASLQTGTLDWDLLMKNCSWFHFSAISPALNEQTASLCEEAAREAKKRGLTVSIDLNYRASLWKYGKSPIDVMPAMVQYCDVVMGNIWSANSLLGIELDIVDNSTDDELTTQARSTSQKIMKQFPACSIVANTFRFDKNKGIRYFATLTAKDEHVASPVFETDIVKDKVGSGDCFMGGLIYGLYNKLQRQDIINFAAAAAFGKLQETGDSTRQSVDDVRKIINGKGTINN